MDAVKDSPVVPAKKCAEVLLPQPQFREDRCAWGVDIDAKRIYDAVVNASQLDLSSVKVDLSQSTVDLLSTNGWGVITLNLADSSKVTQSFQWQVSGNQLMLTSPQSIELVVLNHIEQLEIATVFIDDIRVASSDGVNTFVAETKVEDVIVHGTTESWYVEGNSCEGIFPDPQLCG